MLKRAKILLFSSVTKIISSLLVYIHLYNSWHLSYILSLEIEAKEKIEEKEQPTPFLAFIEFQNDNTTASRKIFKILTATIMEENN